MLTLGWLFLTILRAFSVSSQMSVQVGGGSNLPASTDAPGYSFFPGLRSALEATYLSYEDAKLILNALQEVLPAELKNRNPLASAEAWPSWVARHDTEIRARLRRGEEDSLINFLLFGTSFTRQPRLTSKQLARLALTGKRPSAASPLAMRTLASKIVQARIADLVRALATPGKNERLLFLRRLVEKQGYDPAHPAERVRLREYVVANLVRVLREQESFSKSLEAARLPGNPTEEFAERSKLYRERGLSLDTSLKPNFAVEESLKAMQARSLLAAGGVHRAAIIGPGLDFTDKTGGYDFYSQQTLQPFALIDSLLRLGLARLDALEILTFDLSERVDDHLRRARERAQRGQGYVLQLPRDPQGRWKPETIQYWERFGNQIGTPVSPIPAPASAGTVKTRAVRIRPGVVSYITPVDLNIVLQNLDLPPTERFDLIIATNIFVYYDVLDQLLAMANVARMLRPGGFLLSNNALLELPNSQLRSLGYLTVIYSDRPDDGDHIVWYQRAPPDQHCYTCRAALSQNQKLGVLERASRTRHQGSPHPWVSKKWGTRRFPEKKVCSGRG